MDAELSYSNVLIDNHTWNNFYSEILPVEQSEVYFDPTKLDKPTDLLESQLDDRSVGFGPMIQNHVISANTVDYINLQPHYDFNNCMGQVELWTKRAMMVYKEKESAVQYSTLNQDFLQQQIKQRDEAILRLQKEIEQEKVRGSQQVLQLRHELCVKTKLVNDYREQLKDLSRKFEEYTARVLHHLTHSDNAARSGSLVLSTKGYDQH